jgi:hypothetical protein
MSKVQSPMSKVVQCSMFNVRYRSATSDVNAPGFLEGLWTSDLEPWTAYQRFLV